MHYPCLIVGRLVMTAYLKKFITALAASGLAACGQSAIFSGARAEESQQVSTSLKTMGAPLALNSDLAAYSCGAHNVQICHFPPGNPDNRHTLCIGIPAVAHHLSEHQRDTYGDYLGPCAGSGGDSSGGSS